MLVLFVLYQKVKWYNVAMEATNYWNSYDNPKPRPIDVITDTVSPQQMNEFLSGCEAISILTDRARPDVIFVPERGASPIIWAVDEFLQSDGKSYPLSFLPIGTNTDSVTGRLGGYRPTAKKEMIDLEIDRFKTAQGIDAIRSALLIDEVQSGSTISTASKYIAQALPETKFYVIAVQDDRKNVLHKAKVPAFKMLATNEKFGVQTSVVPVPMFNIDKVGFLNTLLRPSDASEENQSQMLMTMHNVDSEKTIRALALAVKYPKLLSNALARAQAITGETTMAQRDKEFEIEEKIFDWINGFMNSEDTSMANKKRQKRILFWLNRLASQNNNHDEAGASEHPDEG